MATERFAAWVKETKEAVAAMPTTELTSIVAKAVVYALLTIAIAIHEAADTKGKK